jgi:hypothetical protein
MPTQSSPRPKSTLLIVPLPGEALQEHHISTDRELLTAASAGDTSAWCQLVNRYAQTLWTAIAECGLDELDVKAICQQTWLLLAQHALVVAADGDIERWLLVTAHGEAAKVRLRRWMQRTHGAPPSSLPVVPFARAATAQHVRA